MKQTNELPPWLQDLTRLAQRLNERGKNHSSYSAEDRALIGKYAAEHGPTKASRHFKVPESTARLMKKQYLVELNAQRLYCQEVPEVTRLPTKQCGRPLLLGITLDNQVKEYITALRATAGVVNTSKRQEWALRVEMEDWVTS